MRRLALALMVVATCFALVGCTEDESRPTQPLASSSPEEIDPDLLAAGIVDGFGWEIEPSATPESIASALRSDRWTGLIEGLQRQVLGDVVHYSGIVRTGPNFYDKIGIHRVVKESAAYKPIKTKKAVFLQHGASSDFKFGFLPCLYTDNLPPDFGLAIFLARNDIDVWGIDQAWCLVPPNETDFSFMVDWGIPRLIDDLGTGVQVARLARRMTGNGWDQMLLLGYSFGAEIGFGLLDGEAQLPPGQRQIKGFIPVDMVTRAPSGTPFREFLCAYLPYFEGQLANGIYGEGAVFRPMGELARDDPNGDSPYFPGLTNLQAAVTLGTIPIYGEGNPFHLFAGIFENDVPVGMQYVSTEAWVDLMCNMSPVEPNLAALDQCVEICEGDVPWNRHWHDIRVPIFYVGGRGGMGEQGIYQLGFLGSPEVSTLIVSTVPEDVLLDFGHIDLWIAGNSPDFVWSPICDWILDHSSPGHRESGQEEATLVQ